ncbi:MAG: DUF4920 domain-containing protein [Nonlabens sp.]|nr:DUF4920 domain-containing protein [Nonlabens sp.]
MKKILLATLIMSALVSCKEQNADEEMPALNDEQVQEMAENSGNGMQEPSFMNYGAPVTVDGAMTAAALEKKFANLKEGDTLQVKVRGIMESVCVNKGCWADLKMGDGTASVKFKDYGFFVPKNAAGKEAIFNGIAFKSVTPVDELRHYAEDAGKSKEEIAAITEPKVTLSILADGALVEKFDNPDVIIPEKKTK